MTIRTVQWNIGGGKIRQPGNKPEQEQRYDIEGIDYISELIRGFSPDFVTLQETHASDKLIQAESLAKQLGLPHFSNDVYDQSHIESGQGLGQSLLSRFPVSNHTFEFFTNPHYELTQTDGTKWVSHNKGISACTIELPSNQKLVLATLHMIPFRKFGIDPSTEAAKELRDNMTATIKGAIGNQEFLLQGDFNFDNASLKPFLPEIFAPDVSEAPIENGTTPKGRKYDHIIYRGLTLKSLTIKSEALTDHYPLFVEFEI